MSLYVDRTKKEERKKENNSFGWVWFGLSDWVCFGLVCLFHRQTNKLNKHSILINLICEFVFGYSTDKLTN